MIRKIAVLALICILGLPLIGSAEPLTDPMSDPFRYFNVYSLGDIGSSSNAYGSDFQGSAGAGGDVNFNSFTLLGMDSDTGVLLHTGGSATLDGGSYLGGLEIGQDLTIGSLNIEGNIQTGGNVGQTVNNVGQTGGGTINGDLSAAGAIDLNQQMTVNGISQSNAAYTPMVDHLALSVFFKSTSEMIGSWDATGSLVNIYGALSFHGTRGINVVTITASELLNAWGFTINAPEDAVVYINVVNDDGSPVNLDSTGWTYAGGIAAGNVLLNLPEAESLNLTSSNNVNILAPFASTVFSRGLITGSLVVGSLEGSGQVNLGHFMAGGSAGGTPNPVPEPGTMALMLVGLLVVLMGRTRMKKMRGLRGISGRITKGWA